MKIRHFGNFVVKNTGKKKSKNIFFFTLGLTYQNEVTRTLIITKNRNNGKSQASHWEHSRKVMMQLTHSTQQSGTRPVFGVVGGGAVETVACGRTHGAIWRAGLTSSLRGMEITPWTGFTTLLFKEVSLHSELICVKTETMLRVCMFLC